MSTLLLKKLKLKIDHSPKIKRTLCLVLGCFSSVSFAPSHFLPALFIGLSFLFYTLNTANSKKEAFQYAFYFGFGLGFLSLAWISNALLIDGGTYVLLIPFLLMGLGLLFGLFYAVPASLSCFAQSGFKRLFAFSGLFVFFEWVRSWLLTGFPWNLTGYIWNDVLPILQSASVWGVYGLSLITVLTFSSGAFLPKVKPLLMSMGILVILYGLGLFRLYGASHDMVFGVQLRLVQPNIEQSLKWNPQKAEENLSKLIRLSRENNQNITHVIWPEAAVSFLIDQNEMERLRLMSAIRQGSFLITGGLRGVDPIHKKLSNSLFILDDMTNLISYYDKSHLVPFGEYVPLKDIIPIPKVVPLPADFQAGTGIRTITIPKAPTASPLICYEIIFPGQVALKKPRPNWLLNITNDAWYGISAGPYQHLGIAQMRAVEEGLPVVRGTNNGISAVINPYGQIIASKGLGEEGIIDSPLPRSIDPTPYAKLGNLIPLTLSFLFLIIGFLKKKK